MEQNAQIQQMEGALENAGYTQQNAEQTVYAIVSGTLNAAAGQITSDSINSSILPGVTGAVEKMASSVAISSAGGVVNTVNSSISSYQAQMDELKKATQTLSDGAVQVSSGATQLSDGISQLAAGSGSLVQGAASLNDNAQRIESAVTSLKNGSGKIETGLTAAEKGNAGLTDSLYHGMYQLSDSTRNISDQTIQMFSNPVQDAEDKITTVDNNGSSMAAYMMTVAVWVAGLAFCMIYPIERSEADKKKMGFAFWFGKASVMYPLSVAYSVLMVAALYLLDGFRPERFADTMEVACLSAVTFISILYLFNVVLKKAGTYLMFIFMVIQLSGSMGTYPAQLSAPFVSKISKYLPFTYSIRAFRSTISGGNNINPDLRVLEMICVVFIILTWLYYFLMDYKKIFLRRKTEENPVNGETLTNEKNMLY
jgi:putative membrane protein